MKQLDSFGSGLIPKVEIITEPMKRVPNKFPTITNQPYKIAIVGESPGRDEHYQGAPFVGISGRLLTQLLSKAHVIREACFIGNVCQYRPADNDISQFEFTGQEITSGLKVLEEDLAKFNPNIVLLLGKTALRCALGKDNIGDWRGSLFISQIPGPFYGRKCMASYHPAACLRQWEWSPLLMMDIKKCKDEATSSELILPNRTLISHPTYEELLTNLDDILVRKPKLSPDIEGGVSRLPCCSLANGALFSVIVPFENLDGSSYWPTEDEEFEITKRFVQIMADSQIHKIFQNGLYDRFVLQYSHDTFVAGNTDDTMLQFWEMYCELEKSLGFQGSILTKEQYYKFERKASDRETFYRYCCKDSALTFEINEKLDKILTAPQKEHYYFNIALLNALLYMELRGIKYDTKLAKARLLEINHQIYELQHDLDSIAGCSFDWDTNRQLSLAKVQSTLCYKRDASKPRKGNENSYEWCFNVLNATPKLTKSEQGRLNIECGLSMNIKSINFKKFLYETLKLPKQYKEERLTTDYEALLKIQKKQPSDAVAYAIDLGIMRTRSQMLEIHADGDGRIRCGYNICGTETGRLSCYTSPTGSGYNLQTIPSENSLRPTGSILRAGMRDLFICDPDHYFFQCDLKGADGWTVGAYMSMLGDSTMLDDLKFGLKPANLVCLLLRHGNHYLDGKNRQEIRELCKEVNKEDFDYYLCKQGIWMSCYIGGPQRLASLCLVNSEGKINLSLSEVKSFQAAVFSRYRVRIWHSWMGHELKRNNNTLTAPNGFKRRFFGRDDEILGQALAHMPQVITTYATNKAMFRLWTDIENRIPMERGEFGSNKRMGESAESLSNFGRTEILRLESSEYGSGLRIQPLHQVHDALCGQFKITNTAWAVDKLKSYFDNPITIAGITLIIPFDGQYGTNWALDDKSKVGTI